MVIKALKQQGFTLIEVMVALMILAVVAITASQASLGYMGTVQGMKTRTLANFVAQNMAADLKINDKFITTSNTTEVSQQGRNWKVIYTPETASSGSEKIQSVNINVAEIVESGTGTGSNITVFLYKSK